jgi:hypothetical protein
MVNRVLKIILPFAVAIGTLFPFTSCQDPIALGLDLLDQDQAQVDFTDTIQLRGMSLRGDSVRTFTPALSAQMGSYLFGDFADPVFGRTRSAIYTTPRPEFFRPNFQGSRLDSIVLVLPYDTAGIYGDISATFGIEVGRLNQTLPRNREYFSNFQPSAPITPITQAQFVPKLDSLPVIRYTSNNTSDTIRFPHLRLHLPQNLGLELLNADTTVYRNDSSFQAFFNGLRLLPTLPTPGLLSFQLADPPYLGGIYLYYTQSDSLKRQFHFEIDEFSVRFATYEHTYEGAFVQNYLDNPELGDSLLFVQGMAGLNARLEIPISPALQNVAINKAELEIFLTPDPAGASVLAPARQIILSSPDRNGQLRIINDVALAGNNIADRFGGILDKNTLSYRMNISSHFQGVLDGRESPFLFLTIFPKSETGQRSVLYGARHPDKGVKIRLAFTKL